MAVCAWGCVDGNSRSDGPNVTDLAGRDGPLVDLASPDLLPSTADCPYQAAWTKECVDARAAGDQGLADPAACRAAIADCSTTSGSSRT